MTWPPRWSSLNTDPDRHLTYDEYQAKHGEAGNGMALSVYEDLEQGSPEWLQARCGIVTASTVGKLLTATGKVANNDTSRALTQSLVAERITGRVEYMFPNRDMQRGTMLEPYARDLYAAHYAPVTEVGFMRLDSPDAWSLGYSPDGLVGDDGLLEIKSRNPRTQINAIMFDRVPAANMAQLQAGLLVTGRDWIDYCSYSPGLPLYVKRVHPDRAWFAAITEAVDTFTVTARQQINAYRARTTGMPNTEWFDPFDQEEEITFG